MENQKNGFFVLVSPPLPPVHLVHQYNPLFSVRSVLKHRQIEPFTGSDVRVGKDKTSQPQYGPGPEIEFMEIHENH